MIERHGAHSTYLQFESLAAVPGITHAVFTRRGGFSAAPFEGLNASSVTGDDLDTVRRNKGEIVEVLGLPLVGAKPVHAGSVTQVTRLDDGLDGEWIAPLQSRLRTTEADAMVAAEPGFALCWAFGDCAPILLVDPLHRAFALVHAGWRGTAAGIAVAAVRAMWEHYGTRPEDMLAGVGPCIGACCYEVSQEVRQRFEANPMTRECAAFAERDDECGTEASAQAPAVTGKQLYLDIAESNYRQLLAAGVAAEHIESSGYCTGCRTDLFYSHRREPWPSGRFAVGIGRRW